MTAKRANTPTLKIMTILGTRPEIIRLSRVIAKLDESGCKHVLVHTGQNSQPSLSGIFFKELGIRKPDYHLDISADSAPARVGKILSLIHPILQKEKPDKILILGDTFSGLSAYAAKLLGIPVFHMEAGNRCFDDRVPEEINRPVIDRLSRYNLPYTEHSRRHLLAEGFAPADIFVTGNPIFEVLEHYKPRIRKSAVLKKLSLKEKNYFLLTFHRAENVDDAATLKNLVTFCDALHTRYKLPVIVSTHPRTANQIKKSGVKSLHKAVRFLEPLGFFDFVRLMQSSKAVLSDSGTVPEEASILNIPSVILRSSTERPELLECGSTLLSGVSPEGMMAVVEHVLGNKQGWILPAEYKKPNVSETVCGLLTGMLGMSG